MKKVIVCCASAVVIALVAFFAVQYRYTVNDKISVTGLGEKEFVSDLIVWEGQVSVESRSLIDGYRQLEQQKDLVTQYIRSQGIADSCVVMGSISSFKTETPIYQNGNYIRSEFSGYSLSQNVRVESQDVDKVESLSREITSLIAKGVSIMSYSPQYYYTRLEELKLQIIAQATADAQLRAETIAKESKASLGGVASAKMGIFQIVGANSNEDFSWGGTYNTSSKNKKATITMRLDYHIK